MFNYDKWSKMVNKFNEENPIERYHELLAKQMRHTPIKYVGQLPKVNFVEGLYPLYINDLYDDVCEEVLTRLENIANTCVKEKVLNEFLRRAWLYYGQKDATWDDLRDLLKKYKVPYRVENFTTFDEEGERKEKYITILYEGYGLTDEELDEWEFLTDEQYEVLTETERCITGVYTDFSTYDDDDDFYND